MHASFATQGAPTSLPPHLEAQNSGYAHPFWPSKRGGKLVGGQWVGKPPGHTGYNLQSLGIFGRQGIIYFPYIYTILGRGQGLK
jgi:hypothetical protein